MAASRLPGASSAFRNRASADASPLLEKRLGVRLIQRSTRLFAVTEIGREYYDHCVAMLVEADAAQEVVDRMRTDPQGVVRVACPTALVYYEVGRMLARFMARCPRVEVHLESTNRRVDVIREGFDLALRVRFPPLEDSDLVMRVLGRSTQCLVAHPKLLFHTQAPVVPADLHKLPSLDTGPARQEHAWTLEGPNGASAEIRHHPRLATDDMVALRFAVLEGVGIAKLPSMMVREDLREGRMVELLPGWSPRSGIVHAVFPSRRGLLPSVRTLLDFLASEYEALGSVGSQVDVPDSDARLKRARAPSHRP